MLCLMLSLNDPLTVTITYLVNSLVYFWSVYLLIFCLSFSCQHSLEKQNASGAPSIALEYSFSLLSLLLCCGTFIISLASVMVMVSLNSSFSRGSGTSQAV